MRRRILLLAFCAVGVAAVAATGRLSYTRARDSIEHATFERLTALREAKRRAIEGYFAELRAHIRLFSSSATVADAMENFTDAFDTLAPEPSDATALDAFYHDEFEPRIRPLSLDADIHALIPENPQVVAAQATFIAKNRHPVGSKHQLEDPADGTAYALVHAQYHDAIRAVLETYDFYDIFLIEPASGHIVYSVYKETDFATSLDDGPYRDSNLARVYHAALDAEPDQVVLADFERYTPSYGAPGAFLASPIVRNEQVIGVLAAQVPVGRVNDVMTGRENWIEDGLGESGETYLVGPDMLMRSDSRFILESPDRFLGRLEDRDAPQQRIDAMRSYRTTILFERVETDASLDALAGRQGTRIVDDYRGIPVLSSYAPLSIEGIDWAILSEIDVDEAFAPLAALQSRLLILSAFISALFVGAGVGLSIVIGRNETMLRESDRIRHDLSIASSIQKGLLPRTAPTVDGFEIAGWSRPADQTGGDYFDWQLLPDGRLAISLADVTGHGIGPALVTAVCRAYARASFLNSGSVGALMDRINALLVDDLPEDRFVTFVVGLLDPATKSIELLSAGHGPLLIYRAATDSVESHGAHDLPFGIDEGISYGPPDRLDLKPGDMLILITDGFFEWPNDQGEMFGLKRLDDAVRTGAHHSAEALIHSLRAIVERFVGDTPQPDDLTAVVIKRTV